MVSLNPVVLGITLLVLGAGAILGTLRRNQADDKGISIEKEVEPNLPPVLGDVERIH